MQTFRTPGRSTLVIAFVIALVAAGGALALQRPGRTIVRNGSVRLVALNQASFAFMIARSKADCDHIELWNTDTKDIWRFGKPGPCTNLGSTGTGISAVGVSRNRALWIRYTGGNFRDWQLMTATTTQKSPKQLRFVEQDVDLPSPFLIGDSTSGLGVPYAAGKEVVLLGANGVAVFKAIDPANIVRVTAGKGPGGAVVAALRETGEVVLYRANGTVSKVYPYAAGAVKAMALTPGGLVVQLPGAVQIQAPAGSKVVNLPAGGTMIDYAEGRILYKLGSEVHSFKVANASDTLLLKSQPGRVLFATQDTHGLGWAQGPKVSFACGGCVKYAA
ncbi:MAG: hypothetical protein LH654_12400 [Thermoleophilia bacterium]|nr:hypothetical protein [Thermoleophilia bacterium]